jgi:hypothetical protein
MSSPVTNYINFLIPDDWINKMQGLDAWITNNVYYGTV